MVLAYYESIRQVSHRMLVASRRNDWDAVAAGEREVDALAAQMRESPIATSKLDLAGRRRKLEILRQVLADDAEIRGFAQPWIHRADAAPRGGQAIPCRTLRPV